MKLKTLLCLSACALLLSSLTACHSKKKLVKTPPPVASPKPDTTAAPVEKPAPVEEKKEEPAPPAKPDYNFRNIQFEFNSGVLKTDAYPILDKAVLEMKKDPTAKFVLNGHSSAEGTDAHNMELSVERATSVKTYLVNSGIPVDNLSVKGYGESKPIANNKTESGRVLNRRVEIQKL